jgi:hypothetical protein
MEDRWGNGTDCPCCDQFAKVYPRRINSIMARWAIALYKAMHDPREGSLLDGGPGWVHVDKLANYTSGTAIRTGDYGKLRWWDLVEAMPNDDPDKRNSGFWRLTPKGVAFVLGKITVTKTANVYADTLLGMEGEQVSIESCLGKKFSYREIMAPAARA